MNIVLWQPIRLRQLQRRCSNNYDLRKTWQPIRLRQLQHTCYYYDTLNNTGNLYVYANCNLVDVISCKVTELATYTSTPIATCLSTCFIRPAGLATYTSTPIATIFAIHWTLNFSAGNLYVYANCNRMGKYFP